VHIKDLAGTDLGLYEVQYNSRDAILYALAVGASATQLDLVYERDLRVLPTYACALGLWAVEKAGELGAYDRKRSLHASQSLTMHRAMPREGKIATGAKVQSVWDKGKATIVEIVVNSDYFDALYTIFLPGIGNWGGQPSPEPARAPSETAPDSEDTKAVYTTSPDQAAVYRLTGDFHPIHIDPEVARANGFNKPILHGLCTLGIATRLVAETNGAHPCDLRSLKARLSAPVMPGETVVVRAHGSNKTYQFEASVDERAVLKGGEVVFA
jgi:acyl dehydratase